MIRIGIVGCGYWGSKHLRIFNELPNSRVVAVCDLNPERVLKVTRAYRPELFTSEYEELLASDVDAVVIATPARTHFRLAREALLRDKHVLVEKPFTTDSTEALELAVLAEKRELTLMVGHTYIYNPAVAFLRDFIQSGQLGRLYHVHAARLNFGLLQPDVDVLWDLAPHDLSIILHLLDHEPIAVGARGVSHISPPLCEVAHIDLQFPEGVLAHVHVSWLHPHKVRTFTVAGSERLVIYDDMAPGETIKVYDKTVKAGLRDGSSAPYSVEYGHGPVTIPYIAESEPLKDEAAHFLRCIRTAERPLSDAWAALKVVRILETVERSVYNGGSMETHQSTDGARVKDGAASVAAARGKAKP